MLDSLPKPAIFAHRGASAYSPENTMIAFEMAVQQGADAIELDAQLSADRQAVVIHDHSVDRTTPAHGRVEKMSLAELTSLDAGTYYDNQYRGERIPSLETVLERFGKRIFINIELKNEQNPLDELPLVVADLIEKYHLQSSTLISSFNPAALMRMYRRAPDLPRALLASPGQKGIPWRILSPILPAYQAYHAHFSDVTEELITTTRDKGQRLHAYTVNSPDELRRLFQWKIDGVFSDDPALARQTLARQTLARQTLARQTLASLALGEMQEKHDTRTMD